jgi:hypothetical protein
MTTTSQTIDTFRSIIKRCLPVRGFQHIGHVRNLVLQFTRDGDADTFAAVCAMPPKEIEALCEQMADAGEIKRGPAYGARNTGRGPDRLVKMTGYQHASGFGL